MSLTETPPRFTIKGWHVLVGFLVFFGSDIAINTAYIMSAVKTFPGETSVTPYEDGLAYDSALQQLHDQEARGWRIGADADPAGQVRVRASDKAGAPLRGLTVTATLVRPATETGKRALAFHEVSPGVYAAAAGPLDGGWDLDLTLIDARGEKALADRRLRLP